VQSATCNSRRANLRPATRDPQRVSTLGELRNRYRALALERRVNARDVDLLLGDAMEKSLPWLLAHDDEKVEARLVSRFESSIARRFRGEPVQYIRGHAEFYGRTFLVDPRVLIPRPETELLVDSIIDFAPRGAALLDVGTGSGCIAVSAKLERGDLHVTGSDRSVAALAVARTNAARLGGRVGFAGADLTGSFGERFDVIVSNPPYIPLHEYRGLEPEVLEFEPPIALVGGEDGLRVIARLLEESIDQLSTGGMLMMEIGFGQHAEVLRRAEKFGWSVRELRSDLAAIPRVVILERLD
jgi:release factor glutamine methyltransferase